MTSWGLLLTQLREVQTLKHYPWLISPAGFIVISVLCFNFIGDALRDSSFDADDVLEYTLEGDLSDLNKFT